MKEQNKDIYNNLLSYAIASRDNYIAEKHHVAIASALEAVERGDIKRLIVRVPSGTGVTELVSKCFVEWYMGKNKDKSVILNTYRSEVANYICNCAKANMATKLYSDTFQLFVVDDSSRGIINKTGKGRCYPVGTGSAMCGIGANLIIMDTPARIDGESHIHKQYLAEWYRYSLYLKMRPDAAIIVCETPSNHYFSSWVLGECQQENWTLITMPTIYGEV